MKKRNLISFLKRRKTRIVLVFLLCSTFYVGFRNLLFNFDILYVKHYSFGIRPIYNKNHTVNEIHEVPSLFQTLKKSDGINYETHSKISSTKKRVDSLRWDACPVLKIKHKYDVPQFNLSCKPHKPSQSGCRYAAKEFKYNIIKNTCSKNDHVINICKKVVIGQNTFECSFEDCERDFKDEVYIHTFEEYSGDVVVIMKEGDSKKTLEEKVAYAAEESMKKGFNFMFLSCGGDTNKTQFLPLFPEPEVAAITNSHASKESENISPVKDRINVNVLLFDSISRAHFYRSLKKTIKVFNNINSNNEENNAGEVLDFELFQAIHGHSQENGYAFMTGKVFPKNISKETREEEPVQFQQFFKLLKERGYQTLYQDDMCYSSGYGIIRDAGYLSVDWNTLDTNLKKYGNIDDYGLTFASCKLIQDTFNGDTAHFNMNGDQNVCYNGRPNDAYFLDYNLKKFQSLKKNEKLFSYNNIQFAHDAWGLNTQTMDLDLAKYVQEASTLEDTLTIILADHGNAYSDYTSYEMEGRYEMYHPCLFMIIPKSVKNTLGLKKMKALRLNQKRIQTAIDIHNGIHHIADIAHLNKGFLEVSNPHKNCNNIALGTPNLCVCEGTEFSINNSTDLIAHIEHAIGTLNNVITNSSKNGKCKRVIPIAFENTLQYNQGEGVVTSFDIITSSGKGSNNKNERFNFEIYHRESELVETSEMKLMNIGRISKYGIYNKRCSDAVNKHAFRFCICDSPEDAENSNNNNKYSSILSKRTSARYEIFKPNVYITEQIIVVIKNKLSILVREYIFPGEPNETTEEEKGPHVASVTFETINVDSSNTNFYINIKLKDLWNMKKISINGCHGVVKANTMSYLCTVQRISTWKAYYNYTFDYKIV